MSFTLAIIGRPNVGKSTLFNRLIGKRLAIVDDTPGVTRDRREGEARLSDLRFTIIDTAGLEEAHEGALEARMREQTERALAEADAALFLIDARAGLTPMDKHFADWLRRGATPVILVANKCEGRGGEAGLLEAYALGLGDPIPFSAEHGEGLVDLYEALQPFAHEAPRRVKDRNGGDGPLSLAIVGRPNVGKSTLVNKLLGEERMLTGPDAGVTRDAIATTWKYKGREIRMVDTAGLRRKARVREKLESLSTSDTIRTIRFAQVVVLVLEGAVPDKQDLTIARKVIDEGRALIIAVNKWDRVKDKKAVLEGLGDRLEKSLPQVRGIPIITLSALTGKGIERLLPAVFDIFDVWNRRVPTAGLNRWLDHMTQRHPPPLAQGRRVRLRYITQAKTRPPTFVVFTSRPVKALPESYMRYLVNALREDFNLPGIPIRLHLKKGKNPYADK